MNLIFQWRLNWNTIVGKVEKRQVQTSATSLGSINTAFIGLPLDYNKNSMGKDVEQRRCYVHHVNCYSLQTNRFHSYNICLLSSQSARYGLSECNKKAMKVLCYPRKLNMIINQSRPNIQHLNTTVTYC